MICFIANLIEVLAHGSHINRIQDPAKERQRSLDRARDQSYRLWRSIGSGCDVWISSVNELDHWIKADASRSHMVPESGVLRGAAVAAEHLLEALMKLKAVEERPKALADGQSNPEEASGLWESRAHRLQQTVAGIEPA
jgi:hypothetical protein